MQDVTIGMRCERHGDTYEAMEVIDRVVQDATRTSGLDSAGVVRYRDGMLAKYGRIDEYLECDECLQHHAKVLACYFVARIGDRSSQYLAISSPRAEGDQTTKWSIEIIRLYGAPNAAETVHDAQGFASKQLAFDGAEAWINDRHPGETVVLASMITNMGPVAPRP